MCLHNYKLTTTTKLHINNNKNKKINLHTFPFQFSITHINSFSCIAMYDCTSPIVEQQMTTILTHYTLHLSTSHHHQMPVWWGHLTKLSVWPKGWSNVKMTWHNTIPGHQMPLWGYAWAQMYQVHLKIWTQMITQCEGMSACKCQGDLTSDCKCQADLM